MLSRGPAPPPNPEVYESYNHPLTPLLKRVHNGLETHEFNKDVCTPIKSKIKGVIEYAKMNGEYVKFGLIHIRQRKDANTQE